MKFKLNEVILIIIYIHESLMNYYKLIRIKI
jgi:hypothetical protein